MTKLGILYVGIGRYITFWADFYKTCEQYFCPQIPKRYYLVTDAVMEVPDNVTIVPQDDLGWPCNVVFRYLFFLRIKEQLCDFDYVFFFNGNTRFRTVITPDEFFPTESDGGLLALTWKDGTEDADEDYLFERRRQSEAYIPYGTRSLYLQSGITGGLTERYIAMLEECHRLTMADFGKGIVPRYQDESVYNRYMQGRKCKLVDSTYGRPEHRDKRHTAKIVFATKEKVLGRSYMRHFKKRGHSDTWLRKLLKKMGLISA